MIRAELALSRRTFQCDACGHEADRDLNAARNLEHLATSFAVTACGEEHSGPVRKGRVKRSSVKQELDGEVAWMVDYDHRCGALRQFEGAVQPTVLRTFALTIMRLDRKLDSFLLMS